MGIITSIYESTGAFSIHIKDTDNVILFRGGEVDSIVYIQKVGEMYNEQIDCRIFTKCTRDLNLIAKILQIKAIIAFEYLDKHVFILNSNIEASLLDTDEYTYIEKELMTEIKGGKYEINKKII